VAHVLLVGLAARGFCSRGWRIDLEANVIKEILPSYAKCVVDED
jgi:hypothetical protein